MKDHKIKPKRGRSVNQLLDCRLASYATAAVASGVGVFGLAQSAEAQVVYTPAHVLIGSHTVYGLDLANNGTLDFILHGSLTANCSTVFSALLANPVVSGNGVEGAVYLGSRVAKVLNAGEPIGSSQRFINRDLRGGVLMGEAIYSPGGGQYRGKWLHVFNRYLGLKFQINGETHFGWARMSVNLSLHHPLQSVLTGYAYETQPNTPIIAGQEGGEAADAPVERSDTGDISTGASQMAAELGQPASLGVLALGAAGLPLWRLERALPGAGTALGIPAN